MRIGTYRTVSRPLTTVVETAVYLSKASGLLSAGERAATVDVLARDPEAGDLIRGTGGLRKVRIGLEGRGKRGGGRVIYWYHSERFPVVLLWVFAKNEASDLTAEQRKQLARETERLIEDFGGGDEGR
jgi:hypothetical protein